MHTYFKNLMAARRPGVWAMCLETGALALATVALGVALRREDPFFSASTFAWSMLGPLLAGLRYGFAGGLGCALVLILGRLGYPHVVAGVEDTFPGQFAFGLLVVGTVSGEFRDVWERRLERSRAEGAYHKRRLAEFSNVYQVLRASHERLEQRVASGGGSLRSGLAELRARLLRLEPGAKQLEVMGETLLRLAAAHCGVLAGAVHVPDERGALDGPPVAAFGDVGPLEAGDPLLARAMETGEVAVSRSASPGGLLAVVPLRDVEGHMHGVLAARRMHFPSIHAETFRTLALLGTHAGDLLSHAPEAGAPPGTRLGHALRRGLDGVARHGLPASLVRVTGGTPHTRAVLQHLAARLRGLDEPWVTRDERGRPVLLAVLPLTDAAGASSCRARLEKLLPSLAGDDCNPAEFLFHTEPLAPTDRVEDVLLRTLGRMNVEDDKTAAGGVRAPDRAGELGGIAMG